MIHNPMKVLMCFCFKNENLGSDRVISSTLSIMVYTNKMINIANPDMLEVLVCIF